MDARRCQRLLGEGGEYWSRAGASGEEEAGASSEFKTGEMSDWLGEGVCEFAKGINGFANDFPSWAD